MVYCFWGSVTITLIVCACCVYIENPDLCIFIDKSGCYCAHSYLTQICIITFDNLRDSDNCVAGEKFVSFLKIALI